MCGGCSSQHRELFTPSCPRRRSTARSNHGQSIAFAARRYGIAATMVVSHDNSREKNAAMRAVGNQVDSSGGVGVNQKL